MKTGYAYDYAVSTGRNRNRAYEAVIKALEQSKRETGVNRKEIAERIGWKPSQLSTYLSGPRNWTLDTIDCLLHAVDAEMEYHVSFNRDRKKSNFYILDNVKEIDQAKSSPIPGTTLGSAKPPRITITTL